MAHAANFIAKSHIGSGDKYVSIFRQFQYSHKYQIGRKIYRVSSNLVKGLHILLLNHIRQQRRSNQY